MVRIYGLLGLLSIFSLYYQCGLRKADEKMIHIRTSAQDIGMVKKVPIVQKLRASENLSIDEQIELYHTLKTDSSDFYSFGNEDELTMYGYSFLWNNKVDDAIKIFKLIVSEFGSANSYDSLGEGYLAQGDTALALLNYGKALAMNPDNFNAEDQIEKMKYPGKPVETAAEKFGKLYTPEAYQQDLDQLGRRLIEVHPNALKFISEDEFWALVEEKKTLITPETTYAEFVWHCNAIIAAVNCSHTSLGRFFQEADMLPTALRFPIQVRLVDQNLYVIDPLNNLGLVKLKDQIISINGVPVSDLIADIYTHIASQGYITTSKTHFFNTWATAMIPYALHFPETYSVVVKGSESPIVLNKAESFKDLFRDPSIKSCGENLCLEMLDAETAVLTIASFNYYPWNDLSVLTDFIDKSMKEINDKGIKNLLIDVRFNGGGSSESSIHLLRYLVKKPFIYYSRADYPGKTDKMDGEALITPFENGFQGKQYFLMDGNGNSTTGHFMSLVKVFNLGTIIGEELGSNQFCSAGQTICRLSNTKLIYYVANNTHVSTAVALPDEKGILPDHQITQDIDAYLRQQDVVKEYAVNLMRKGS
jgi:tetratricopeptide (TPR) repeat protein